jgi:alpha-glucosidase
VDRYVIPFASNEGLAADEADIDYMDGYKVFTHGERFPLDKMRNLVGDLHSKDQHYIVMVDPAVAAQDYDAYNNGVKADVFLKRADGSLFKGNVWPGVAVFPDWFSGNTQEYWNKEFADFFNFQTGIDIDALWIDMNEPSNFCAYPCSDPEAKKSVKRAEQPGKVQKSAIIARSTNGTKVGLPGRDLINPLYKIRNEQGSLSNKTADTDLIHQGGYTEYDTHNL